MNMLTRLPSAFERLRATITRRPEGEYKEAAVRIPEHSDIPASRQMDEAFPSGQMTRQTHEVQRHHLACLTMITGGLDGPCDCGGWNPEEECSHELTHQDACYEWMEVCDNCGQCAVIIPELINDEIPFPDESPMDGASGPRPECGGDGCTGCSGCAPTDDCPEDCIVHATCRDKSNEWLRGDRWSDEQMERLQSQEHAPLNFIKTLDWEDLEKRYAKTFFMRTKSVTRDELEKLYPPEKIKVADDCLMGWHAKGCQCAVTWLLSDEALDPAKAYTYEELSAEVKSTTVPQKPEERNYSDEVIDVDWDDMLANPLMCSNARNHGRLIDQTEWADVFDYEGVMYCLEPTGNEEMSNEERLTPSEVRRVRNALAFNDGLVSEDAQGNTLRPGVDVFPEDGQSVPPLDADYRDKCEEDLDTCDARSFDAQPGFRVESLRSELVRKYIWSGGELIIENPIELWISPSGSHRVVADTGWVTYIPNDYITVQWLPRDPANPVQF